MTPVLKKDDYTIEVWDDIISVAARYLPSCNNKAINLMPLGER